MRCPSCHNDNSPGLRMCDWCGTELPQGGGGAVSTSTVSAASGGAVSGPADKRRTRYDAAPPPPAPAPAAAVQPGKRVTHYEASGQSSAPPAADDFFRDPPPPRPAPLDPDDPFASSVRPAAPPAAAAPPPAAAAPRLAASARQPSRTIAEQPGGIRRRLRAALFVFPGGSDDGTILPVYEGRNSLGRAPDRDIVLEDGRVSGEHGFLYIREERHTYVDTSTNGSRVDGKVVFGEQIEVRTGSVLELGGLRLVLMVVPPEAIQG